MYSPLLRLGLITAAAILVGNGTTVEAARYVRAQVILDGKVILEGNASDNGSRDADELWDALKSVTFKPTEEFEALEIDDGADQAVIESTSPPGEPVNLKIYLAYGGTATRRELHIRRVSTDAQGRSWQLDGDEIADLFNSRMISRREAAKLVDPKRSE